MGDKKQETRPKRVFVSDVDRYSSKHIAEVTYGKVKLFMSLAVNLIEDGIHQFTITNCSDLLHQFLFTCVAGETSEYEETSASPEGEPAFQIVGTVSSSSKDEKRSFLLEQYAVSQASKQALNIFPSVFKHVAWVSGGK